MTQIYISDNDLDRRIHALLERKSRQLKMRQKVGLKQGWVRTIGGKPQLVSG